MALKNIQFQITQGGLQRTAPNEDHISCLIFEFAAPGVWGTDSIKSFRNIQQVEAAGIPESDPVFAEVHYHASEFFRMNPSGKLWINFNVLTADTIVNVTQGEVRQYGIVKPFSLANCNALQNLMNELAALKAPANIIMGCSTISSPLTPELPRNQTNPNVSCLVAGDNGAKGKQLAIDLGAIYIPAVGAVLGAISAASVHESVAWVQKFNFANTELEKVKIFDDALEDMNAAQFDEFDDAGFLIFRKFVGYPGTYLNDTHTCIDITDDYAYIESNRTVQKAIREVYKSLLPDMNSPLYVDADGKLSPDTVGYLKAKAERPLTVTMLNSGELSGFAVDIDPDQDVLSTSQVEVVIRLLPVGVAREIIVKIGLTTNIA